MTTYWLLLALVCGAKPPHHCKPVVQATYPKYEYCQSGIAFLDRYPQPRQIKVWCQRAKPTLAQEKNHAQENHTRDAARGL